LGSPPLFPSCNRLAMGLGWPPPGGVVPVPLPGCVNKGWMEGVVAGVVKFLRWALLSFGTFALAAKRSSLSTCLATAASEVSEPRPWPTDAERKSEVRGEGKDPFGGTWKMWGLPVASALLSEDFNVMPSEAVGEDDCRRWSSRSPPSLLGKFACTALPVS
jgi:hypothetical protein